VKIFSTVYQPSRHRACSGKLRRIFTALHTLHRTPSVRCRDGWYTISKKMFQRCTELGNFQEKTEKKLWKNSDFLSFSWLVGRLVEQCGRVIRRVLVRVMLRLSVEYITDSLKCYIILSFWNPRSRLYFFLSVRKKCCLFDTFPTRYMSRIRITRMFWSLSRNPLQVTVTFGCTSFKENLGFPLLHHTRVARSSEWYRRWSIRNPILSWWVISSLIVLIQSIVSLRVPSRKSISKNQINS